ncbi:MAG: lipase family protein [Xanthomonadales bacterium]|nr:lipase family protein [Xanthomonadales bacterium]
MASLSMYFPPRFDLEKAVYLTKLVLAAYDMFQQWNQGGRPPEKDFHWVPNGPELDYQPPIWGEDRYLRFFKEVEPFGIAGTAADGTSYLAFRGTQTDYDWYENSEVKHADYEMAAGYGQVHKGFYRIYQTMSPALRDTLGRLQGNGHLMVTGHSLGSALSTLAIPDILNHLGFAGVRHYNLASPRTAGPEFARAYNANGVETYRIVNTSDLVTNVPPCVISQHLPVYQHVGTPVDFTAHYGSISGNHDVRQAYLYALQNPDEPEGDSSTRSRPD